MVNIAVSEQPDETHWSQIHTLPALTSFYLCIHQMLYASFDQKTNNDDAQNNPHFSTSKVYNKNSKVIWGALLYGKYEN